MALTKVLGGGGGGGITQLTGDVTAGPGSGSQAATIPNASIGVAKLSATGTPSSTTFLRGDNTWSAASGSSGALVFLGAVTASAASSADFTSLVSSTYDDYLLVWSGVTVGTNNTLAGIQLSANNGSTWLTSGYEYGGRLMGVSTSFETYQRAGTLSLASIGSSGLSSTVVSAGATKLFRANTSEVKLFVSDSVIGNSDGNFYTTIMGARYTSATTFNAIRVLPASGTITGVFRLYGIAKV